ncbi:MAG: hypothetical protein ACTHLW_21825 [Verrucomicrobiota bacterium]
MGLSPTQAKMLLEGNAVNLATQVKDGKPLNAAQVEMLQRICDQGSSAEVAAATEPGRTGPAPKFAKNKSQLAGILNVSRKTIQRYSERDDAPKPRPNGSLSVAEWKAYLAGKDVIDGAEHMDTSVLKARQILLQNRLLEQKIELNDSKVYPVELIEKETVQMIATAKAVLLTGPASLAPQVVGVSIPEAEALLREWIHDALVKLRSNPLGRTDLQEVEDGE